MSTQTSPTFARRGADCLAQIGLNRFDVTGTRFFDGEAGAAGGQGSAAGSDGAGNGAAAGAEGGAGAAAAGGQGGDGNGNAAPWTKENFDPERAGRLVENLRGDITKLKDGQQAAIDAAVAAAQKDTFAQFARLLTGEQEPETDPVKLNESLAAMKGDLTKSQDAAKAASLALKVALLGAPLGANLPSLLADEAFKTSLASVDPTKDADIKSAITEALQNNAALKQPPAQSGAGDHTGPTIQSLESQLQAAQEKKDLVETIRLKQAIAAMRQAQSH